MEWLFKLQGYPLVLLTTLLEGVAVPLPGGLLLAWSGFILGRDLPDLVAATGLGVAGYMTGAIVPYLLGRFGGRPAVEKVCHRFRLPARYLDQAEDWFDRYGLIIVAVSRPFFFGNYVSFIAGMAKTRLIPFLFCTGLGIAPWIFAYLYLGTVLGRRWPQAVEIVSQYALLGLILMVSTLFVFFLTRRFVKSSR
ncbi:MAG TPA: DedA family protein [Clostridia bacterium]|nr:DedA family protein [Clostridia bacterium]